MECPKCKKVINLIKNEIEVDGCSHCGFYLYLQHTLQLSILAIKVIDDNQHIYFNNVHNNIYNPFIQLNEGDIDPILGAEIIRDYLIRQFQILIKKYAEEDLHFTMMGLRELATWKIILESGDPCASTQVRNIAHIFTNLLSTFELENNQIEVDGIFEETDLISLFVLSEEIEKISSNINFVNIFNLKPTLSEIIKTRIENDKLSWFHQYFEVEDLKKPEEISFEEGEIQKYLLQRGIESRLIKEKVSEEMKRIFGFSYENLKEFRNQTVSLARKLDQVFNIFPGKEEASFEGIFVFREQLKKIISEDELENILKYMTYKASFSGDYKNDFLTDPYMDYKFIFTFDNIIAFGNLDSSNSITIFENIASSGHFIENIFSTRVSKVFQESQRDLSLLIGMKIAEHFLKKNNFYVPMQQKGVPFINMKSLIGNGIKKRIMNKKNQDLGDIDAVVVDLDKRKILLFEIKFFKPAINNKELIKKDKKILEDINKIIARSVWFEENIQDVKKAWGLEGTFDVETIIVTGRPNYFGKEIERKYEKVKYNTFDGVLRL